MKLLEEILLNVILLCSCWLTLFELSRSVARGYPSLQFFISLVLFMLSVFTYAFAKVIEESSEDHD